MIPFGTSMAATNLLLGARVVSAGKHSTIATWLDVCVVIWRSETLATDVRLVSETLDRLAETNPHGVGLVQYVDDDAQSLSSEARAALAKLLQKGAAYIKCSVIVYNGEGFRAAAIRAVVTAVAWLARPGFPHEVVGAVPAGARLVGRYLAPEKSRDKWAELLAQVIENVRRFPAASSATEVRAPIRAKG